MQFGAVALVLAEAILGKPRTEVTHHRVTRDLRDHTGRRDRETDAISVHDGSLRERERINGQTINQDVLRRPGQRRNRRAHRLVRRAQDIDLIDLRVVYHPDGPRNFAVTNEFVVDLFAQFGCELLGILQFAMPEFLGKDRRRRDNRPGQRTAPGFIDSGNARDANGAQFLFITKTAAPIHRRSFAAETSNSKLQTGKCPRCALGGRDGALRRPRAV
jgi:hypothetical protein